ncbi:hepatitis A virus cellular receptor 1 homolog isoform X2 [Betta splendens]|uniref:Hepatitis A virus cellular receptor 1 homolog isoform X2 n=1 Tax=Betta splendens TaxID=158456 RepID=A0A6P7P7Q4_BETSP|nr:hepatitis A virus cellular receptor 1 homolog isoform X2 [Betta splendens]
MLTLLLLVFVSIVTAVHVAGAVTMETVVGVAGGEVELPCRLEAANQEGVDVCWGRGEPSLLTCHDAVVHGAGHQVYYRRSHRLSVSSSFLYIMKSQPSDAGFYHCRLQLPGLFNDQTSTVHLIIIISPSSEVIDSSSKESLKSSDGQEARNLNAPHTDASYSTAVVMETGRDGNTTAAQVAQVQSSVRQQQMNSLQFFICNTVRLCFIIFIPALLLTAAYRVWRLEQRPHSDRRHGDGSSYS